MNVHFLPELPLEGKENPPAQKATRAEIRTAIDAALASDSSRSDRSIADEVGCDHKTVKARRGEIEIPHVGKLERGNSPRNSPPPIRDDGGAFDWSSDPSVVALEQPATAIYYKGGNLVIRQQNWPEDDSVVVITPQFLLEFISKIDDAAGIPSFGRPDEPWQVPTR
jgi:hypothetical protein